MANWRMAFRNGTNGFDLWPDYCCRLGIAIIQYTPINGVDLSLYTVDRLPDEWALLGSPQKTSLKRFVFEMKVNDIIYVKSGPQIIGKGVVISPYYFDREGVVTVDGIAWEHQRKIRWIDVPPVPNSTNQNILTVKPLMIGDVSAIESQYRDYSYDTPSSATLSDIEGLRYEIVTTTCQRSRKLRDRAMRQSRGICGVCKIDYSQVLAGRGIRVLQVHHKRMLSQRAAPARTSLADLVFVCANCHLLLHLDPRRPLTVSQLRKLLGKETQ